VPAHPDSTRRAYVAWVLVCLIWGTTYLGIRIALETVPPFLMAAIRWVIAGGILLVIFGWRGEQLPRPREWPPLLVTAILMIGLGNGAVVWAQQFVPSGLTSVLVAVTPFWMVGVEKLSGSAEPLTVRKVVGLMVGFSGILLLLWPQLQLGQGGPFLAGVASIQLASLGWAIGSSYSKRRPAHENVFVTSSFQMIAAGVLLLAVGSMAGEWRDLSFSGRTLAALAYLVCVGSLLGYTAYVYALKHLPMATVSLYAYVNPVIAVALGTLVLDEPLSPRLVVASAVVLAGIALVRRN
jgi:drug/metabolite transporter (DMT)-like permease